MIYIYIVHVIVLLQHSTCTDFQTLVVVSDFDLELMLLSTYKIKREHADFVLFSTISI
jgi:hypothetical protein